MFLAGILSWWYGDGWKQRLAMIVGRIARTNDYFSIPLLATTLFAPFRQISAGRVDGPIGLRMRAVLDQLISRIVGAFVRTFTIIFGLFVICFQAVTGGIILIFWALIPLLPIIGLVLTVVGWVPSWR